MTGEPIKGIGKLDQVMGKMGTWHNTGVGLTETAAGAPADKGTMGAGVEAPGGCAGAGVRHGAGDGPGGARCA